MKALVIESASTLKIVDKIKPTTGPNSVIVKLHAAGLNKRDQFIREGKYPNIQFGATLGSDGAGVVSEIGENVDKELMGQKVVINPNIDWGNNDEVQSRVYGILGMPSEGTFAEYIEVGADRIHPIPSHMSFEEAAALPLGGLTAYRAVFRRAKIRINDNILISGFGGGVAQFAFQFALAAGANVYVTSGGDKKINQAISMGAQGGFNYNDPDWYKNPWQTKGGFDAVIDSAGGDQINTFVKMMRPGGRIVFYGATNGLPSSIDLYRMFWNQISLRGTTMGNDKEFEDMLAFTTYHKIKPVLAEAIPFSDIVKAFDLIALKEKAGKIVVKF